MCSNKGAGMNGKIVTVLGGDGFVGRYAVQALLKAGARVRVGCRNPKRGWHLKAQANLGQLAFATADVTRPESLGPVMAGADAVVNLVGSFEHMAEIQADGARNVAAAAKKAKVSALVHISAIGADVDSASAYGRTKGEGEAAVRKAFSGATILRPSLIFGAEDAFTNRFAGLIQMMPLLPVIGGATKFQPVFVADVARAITAALADPAVHGGQTYELGGPDVMSMLEINQWLAQAIGRSILPVEVPDMVAGAMATLTGWLPGAPITRDQWLMLQSDNVVGAKAKGLDALGITAISLDVAAPGWLSPYRKHGRFTERATR
jgi:uncharacterized protein YbjT (DUF2867 family)